ncbi:MAG: energy-coupling factor ABC transporter permease [Roseiflexaceae bacterium]|nr:energy-coupling factor ABC transporter permease [Roseiflexaceae bacterium]
MSAITSYIPGASWSLFGAELHIPDGFLNLPISIVCWIGAIALIARAAQQAQCTLDERQMPLMGIMAAFIFAAQMINFPVAGGTSGHLLGGVLAAVTLVVGGDSGHDRRDRRTVGCSFRMADLVMGANILNMGADHNPDRLRSVPQRH